MFYSVFFAVMFFGNDSFFPDPKQQISFKVLVVLPLILEAE
jgi:hypothetical protein